MPARKASVKESGSADGATKTPTSKKVSKQGAERVRQTPGASESGSVSASKQKKKRRFDEKEWNYTHNLPSHKDIKSNGRVEGRNLITWTRKSSLPTFEFAFLAYDFSLCRRDSTGFISGFSHTLREPFPSDLSGRTHVRRPRYCIGETVPLV